MFAVYKEGYCDPYQQPVWGCRKASMLNQLCDTLFSLKVEALPIRARQFRSGGCRQADTPEVGKLHPEWQSGWPWLFRS